MNHLESLISEYYDWKGYLLKRNINVGKRQRGGYDMELDIVAYNPETKHLVHIEPSLDAYGWEKRIARYRKKFEAGKDYIFTEVFPWLDKTTPLEQIAVPTRHPKGRHEIGGGKIKSVDEFICQIRNEVITMGEASKNAIPERLPLLRTIQLCYSGYYKNLTTNLCPIEK